MNSANSNLEIPDKFLPVKEAAKMLSVSPRTIWRMIADGQLTVVRIRRCTRVSLLQVLSYLRGGGKAGCV
jgi:excisionase family DNA binding protein